jgi:multiple sugar transport system permease protein
MRTRSRSCAQNYWRRSLFSWLALSPLVLATLFPFAVMLATALKPASEIMTAHAEWFGSRLAFENFVSMWQATNFGRALWNSLVVSASATFAAILISLPAAYVLSRRELKAAPLLRQFLLVTQMLSPIVLVIGLFRLLASLGIVDSLGAVSFVYAAFNIAFSVWMLQSYFETIPRELEEAAWLDGASGFTTMWRVFLPLATPALTVTAIFTFIQAWNEFVLALTLLRREENYTLTIQIFSLVAGRYSIEWHHVMAATFAATVPVAIVFAWLQRYFVRGLAVGGLK